MVNLEHTDLFRDVRDGHRWRDSLYLQELLAQDKELWYFGRGGEGYPSDIPRGLQVDQAEEERVRVPDPGCGAQRYQEQQ